MAASVAIAAVASVAPAAAVAAAAIDILPLPRPPVDIARGVHVDEMRGEDLQEAAARRRKVDVDDDRRGTMLDDDDNADAEGADVEAALCRDDSEDDGTKRIRCLPSAVERMQRGGEGRAGRWGEKFFCPKSVFFLTADADVENFSLKQILALKTKETERKRAGSALRCIPVRFAQQLS